MKVSELVQSISEMKSDGGLDDQSVEFVLGNKKFFLDKIETAPKTLTIKVTRKLYKELSSSELENILRSANSEANIILENSEGGDNKSVNSVFLGVNWLEVCATE